jgi:hypothetical protein
MLLLDSTPGYLSELRPLRDLCKLRPADGSEHKWNTFRDKTLDFGTHLHNVETSHKKSEIAKRCVLWRAILFAYLLFA